MKSFNDKKPGFVHFDVTQGCTAELLIASLLDLGLSTDPINKAFAALKLPVVAVSETSSGSVVEYQFSDGRCLATPNLTDASKREFARAGKPQKPIWSKTLSSGGRLQSSGTNLSPEDDKVASKSDKVMPDDRVMLQSDSVASNQGLSQIAASLMERALNLLSPLKDNSEQSMKTLCDIVAFAVLLEELNPLGVSASRIPVSWPHVVEDREQSIDKTSILKLLEGVPTLERPWPAPYCDAVGLALLKMVSSNFGVRGSSVLMKTGVGLLARGSMHGLINCRALWCEPEQIDTRIIEGSFAKPKMEHLVKIEGCLGRNIDVPGFIAIIKKSGAFSVQTSQITSDIGIVKTLITMLATASAVEKLIEECLISGEASEIFTLPVERHALRSRTVSVPFGRGQSKEHCGVVEWLYGDKLLRAEPVASDLSLLVQSTGFSQDALRSDVLASWKRMTK